MTKQQKLKYLEKGRVQWLNIANDSEICELKYYSIKEKYYNESDGFGVAECYACLISGNNCKKCPIYDWNESNCGVGNKCIETQYGEFIKAETKKSKQKYAMEISNLFAAEIEKLKE